jgi:hypothetical protein
MVEDEPPGGAERGGCDDQVLEGNKDSWEDSGRQNGGRGRIWPIFSAHICIMTELRALRREAKCIIARLIRTFARVVRRRGNQARVYRKTRRACGTTCKERV